MIDLRKSYNLDSQLYIVGSGPKRFVKKLKRFAQRNNLEIIFAGQRNEPYKYLGKLVRLIVVPSLWEEPLGRIPIEAGMAGIQTLVADIGGLKEASVIMQDGIQYFESGNSLDLSIKLEALMNSTTKPIFQINDYIELADTISVEINKFKLRIKNEPKSGQD
jgi:glycosyltransferase involved in cell wall biosynthesis